MEKAVTDNNSQIVTGEAKIWTRNLTLELGSQMLSTATPILTLLALISNAQLAPTNPRHQHTRRWFIFSARKGSHLEKTESKSEPLEECAFLTKGPLGLVDEELIALKYGIFTQQVAS